MAKLTTEDFVRKARIKHKDLYSYAKAVYAGAHDFVTITCPEHGDFSQRASDHANVGKGCKACGISRSSPPPFTTEEFVRQAKKVHEDKYTYASAVYETYKRDVVITCPEHGDFSQRAGQHLRGNGCPVCRAGNKTSLYKAKSREERARDWAASAAAKHKELYDYTRVVFLNSKTPVDIVCPLHGVFKQSPNNHLNGGCRCPACAAVSKSETTTKSTEDWIMGFRKTHGAAYSYDATGVIVGAVTKIPITCALHGEFLQHPYIHQWGHGCPKCTGAVSKPETCIGDRLQEALPDCQIIRSTRSVIPPYELDLYFPDKKLAVEFNGTHWHSDRHKSKTYHQKKALMCRDRGVKLLHVYEHDWMLRPDSILQLIRGKLGIGITPLNARDLTVREVGSETEFLNANHFQGAVPSAVGYGLFDGDALMALMTFGAARFNKSYKWELLRFCSLAGTRIRGGASRLFTRFVRDHLNPGDGVVSYARLDYSDGGVYGALGFTFDGVCPPDYVWVKQPCRILRRQATQKHRLAKLLGNRFNPTLSEAENMRGAGFKRVYSAGNLRYVFVRE